MSGLKMFRALLCLSAMASAQQGAGEWVSLFDGKSLQGWKEADFRGRGTVRVEKGAMVLEAGDPMTGVNCTAPLPKVNYEVRFEAAKIKGGDFFASLTFPVGDSYATWVLGGWGGDIVGISSLDDRDASENETRTYFEFEPGKWYSMRLQVREDKIVASIDNESVVNVGIAGRQVGLRPGEISKSIPFGFASYRTAGSIRKVEYRTLRPPAGDRRED
jgi:hypothetical protein